MAGWWAGRLVHASGTRCLPCSSTGPPCASIFRVKLAGSYINVALAPGPADLNLAGTADARVRRAIARLPRVSRLPEGMDVKAKTARSLVASARPTGTDIKAPSPHQCGAYNKAVFAAIRPKGRAWLSYCVMLAVCIPGHALEITSIIHRETFLAVRRQVRRDVSLHPKIEYLRQPVQSLFGGGPVGRLWQSIHQLQWRWPSLGVRRNDWGATFKWLWMPVGTSTPMLRASQRRAFL